jgi:hypothetical protein
MTARSLAGCLLLLLASISVVELTLDVAAHPGVQRHQSRVRAQHPSTPRVSQRSGPAVTVNAPAPPVLIALGSIIPVDHPASLPLVSSSVFVPPRV